MSGSYVTKFPPDFENEDDLIRRGDLLKFNMLEYKPGSRIISTGPFKETDYYINLTHVLNVPAVVKGSDFKQMISSHINNS